jgi:hypothetical protein
MPSWYPIAACFQRDTHPREFAGAQWLNALEAMTPREVEYTPRDECCLTIFPKVTETHAEERHRHISGNYCAKLGKAKNCQ